jgi:NAD(P)-dependent dehydrogenase (short-subunit alcohol dehydrogenase family)|tara:strand:+ start:2166 stop:2903 length:738 start_codon:yes stop_codon:yes gene_type:complete
MLKNRSILVTGGARGLGAEIAKSVSEKGAKVIIADINTQEGQQTANKLNADFFHVDLEDSSSIQKLIKSVSKTFNGKLDGLVNNAAIATGIGGIQFEDIDLTSWDKVMRVNVRGTWLMTKAAAPLLRASKSGRIVNISSDTALWGAPLLLSYVASKGAIISMTRSLARELGSDQIGVTAVAPGILTTDSTDYVPEARHSFYNENRAILGPQGAEDITDTISFLLTKGALTLTGQVLAVNNGFVFS